MLKIKIIPFLVLILVSEFEYFFLKDILRGEKYKKK